MSVQQTKQQKPPALKFLAIISIATAVILVLTITPWNIIPTSITEDVKVIATTELGCVGESVLGHSVVVENCSAKWVTLYRPHFTSQHWNKMDIMTKSMKN